MEPDYAFNRNNSRTTEINSVPSRTAAALKILNSILTLLPTARTSRTRKYSPNQRYAR
jgi:hypothetical protein